MWARGLTGICGTHRITVAVAGYDFVVSNTAPQKQEGHGSMVVGVIGAEINNNIGVAGIGSSDAQPRVIGLRLMPIAPTAWYVQCCCRWS